MIAVDIDYLSDDEPHALSSGAVHIRRAAALLGMSVRGMLAAARAGRLKIGEQRGCVCVSTRELKRLQAMRPSANEPPTAVAQEAA